MCLRGLPWHKFPTTFQSLGTSLVVWKLPNVDHKWVDLTSKKEFFSWIVFVGFFMYISIWQIYARSPHEMKKPMLSSVNFNSQLFFFYQTKLHICKTTLGLNHNCLGIITLNKHWRKKNKKHNTLNLSWWIKQLLKYVRSEWRLMEILVRLAFVLLWMVKIVSMAWHLYCTLPNSALWGRDAIIEFQCT